MKKILYIDMDNVLVDFKSGLDKIAPEIRAKHKDDKDEIPGIFSLMDPYPGAIDAVYLLAEHFELYVLSTAPWKNISAWSDKVTWIKKHFGDKEDGVFYKRLILTHHKNLNSGHFLVDDREKNGAKEFTGELIQFGSEKFPDWNSVTDYLLNKK